MQIVKNFSIRIQQRQASIGQPIITEKTYKRALHGLIMIAALLTIMSPEVALAAAPWQSAADAVLGIFKSGLSKSLATIAVIALGIMAAAGKLEWGTAIKVIVGLVLIFGAGNIVGWMADAVA